MQAPYAARANPCSDGYDLEALLQTQARLHLRELTWIRPSYIIPRHDFVSEALVPCLEVADSYRCMAGFFDSGALRDMAPGLAQYIARPGQTMRLIASPFINATDQEAIRKGLKTPVRVLEETLLLLCGSSEVSESALVAHTLDCLAYLIASKRLLMKVSLVPGGLFHPKVWIFEDDGEVLVLHGSSNLTSPGLLHNVEQVTVSRSWRGDDQLSTVKMLVDEFEALWNHQRSYAEVFDLPEAVERELLRRMPSSAPTPDEFWAAWQEDKRRGIVDSASSTVERAISASPRFAIPSELNYLSGDFAHQGRAVDAWEAAGRRGILNMATGSGKTVAALISAQRLYTEKGALLLVIGAPYLPLIEQWREETRDFGVTATVPNDKSSRRARLAEVEGAVRRLNNSISTIEMLVVSHEMLCDADFQAIVDRCKPTKMLIGDEVHNLGRDTFIEHPPFSFEARLGLSATPIRQYDSEGTDALFSYFGPVIFEFTLKDAIGVCLVPYDYYVHPVELTHQEAHQYAELTRKLMKAGWAGGAAIDDHVQRLLVARRRVLEQAESKLDALAGLLRGNKPSKIHHALIYASAKGRAQLTAINLMLGRMGVYFHQLTAEETSQPRLAGEVLEAFAKGQLQVLTAMRVLDEGVDIPEIETAYIVASTTIEREWIQRRGRVLRKCPAIGKSFATIHDFLVLPPTTTGDDIKGLVRGELERIQEFASVADNAGSPGGAYRLVQEIVNRYFV
jgi:superfamily II DNA or RNA helicase